MIVILGVVGAALLFGLFTLVGPGEKKVGCSGHCDGCTGDRACDANTTGGVQR